MIVTLGGPNSTSDVYSVHYDGSNWVLNPLPVAYLDQISAYIAACGVAENAGELVFTSGSTLWEASIQGSTATSSVSFGLTVNNLPPVLTVSQPSVTVAAGQAATNSGTWFDVPADQPNVTLMASVGTATKNGDGTWYWSYTPADDTGQPSMVTITADDGETANSTSSISFGLTVNNLPLIVTPADWTAAGLTLTLRDDGNLHVYTTGTTTDTVPPRVPAGVTNIEITAPSDTTASLTIDSTAGDPIPAGGLIYSGGSGLIITGSGMVTLSGANTYTGGTTISAGTLLIHAASALPGRWQSDGWRRRDVCF